MDFIGPATPFGLLPHFCIPPFLWPLLFFQPPFFSFLQPPTTSWPPTHFFFCLYFFQPFYLFFFESSTPFKLPLYFSLYFSLVFHPFTSVWFRTCFQHSLFLKLYTFLCLPKFFFFFLSLPTPFGLLLPFWYLTLFLSSQPFFKSLNQTSYSFLSSFFFFFPLTLLSAFYSFFWPTVIFSVLFFPQSFFFVFSCSLFCSAAPFWPSTPLSASTSSQTVFLRPFNEIVLFQAFFHAIFSPTIANTQYLQYLCN